MRKEMVEVHKEENKQCFPSNEYSLQGAIGALSSLIVLTHSIKVFHVKWQFIRSKLEELNSVLTTAMNCDFGASMAFSESVSAILVTVNECYDLARFCIDFSYKGKLLMQSNLDVVSAKFDVHIKKLGEINNAGILTHGYAVVLSKPCAGASCDDMKFYVNDLLIRMKVGCSGMKNQALIALNEVLLEDEKYVTTVVEIGGILSLLVKFLELEDKEIQDECMKVISVITRVDCYKSTLVEAGIIAPLVHVLDSGSDSGKEQAARCLQKLTENLDIAWSFSAHGGVTTLLKICSNGACKSDLIGPISGILKHIAGVEEIRRFMVEKGAVPAYIKLLRSTDELVQINAIAFLQVMALRDEPLLQMIIKEGAIQPLVWILDTKSTFSTKARKTALGAIESFCFSSKTSVNILMSHRFLDRLLFLLRDNEVSLKEAAVKAVLRLCGTSEEAMKAMGDAGFMSELLTLLDANCFRIREMTAEALSGMLKVPRNRRRFMEEVSNTSRILQLLDPNEKKIGNFRFLLSALMTLTSSNSGRKKIAISSHLENLERLAEAEDTEAKKIIRKLSTNRFRSILNGIWNTQM